jgi:serine/threonine protein kinase
MKDCNNIFELTKQHGNFLEGLINSTTNVGTNDQKYDSSRFNSDDYFNSSGNNSRDNSGIFDNLRSKNNLNQADFVILELIGSGAYGKVYKAKCIYSGKLYAIKVLDKKHLLKLNKYNQIADENDILNQLCHINVVEIYGAYEDNDKAYLVLEYCSYGDLDCLIRRYCKYIIMTLLVPFNINVVKYIASQIVNGIEYLMESRIVHRDIKPDNIVINERFVLKLVCVFN